MPNAMMHSGLLCIGSTSVVTDPVLLDKRATLLCTIHWPMEKNNFHKLLIPKAFSGQSQGKRGKKNSLKAFSEFVNRHTWSFWNQNRIFDEVPCGKFEILAWGPQQDIIHSTGENKSHFHIHSSKLITDPGENASLKQVLIKTLVEPLL